MSLVFAGACSHAPGITGRAERLDQLVRLLRELEHTVGGLPSQASEGSQGER